MARIYRKIRLLKIGFVFLLLVLTHSYAKMAKSKPNQLFEHQGTCYPKKPDWFWIKLLNEKSYEAIFLFCHDRKRINGKYQVINDVYHFDIAPLQKEPLKFILKGNRLYPIDIENTFNGCGVSCNGKDDFYLLKE